ncbi:hypothetical protein ILUMI_21572 [Ignelater luminosus]|uniref:Uncharacterized protein n=1 Tax=Ignelater luminosus TaxID=2038154 RepID=A0A8K0G3R7_IGNLU|nr:hypothetical protein ILUMI_21572 [Ignelater luminosus]
MFMVVVIFVKQEKCSSTNPQINSLRNLIKESKPVGNDTLIRLLTHFLPASPFGILASSTENTSNLVDIVKLPPEKVDDVADLEDLDENILEDKIPRDLPGFLEVHNEKKHPSAKKARKEKSISSWSKENPEFSVVDSTDLDLEEQNAILTENLRGKTPVQIFKQT